MEDYGMDTILKSNPKNYNDRWTPQLVDSYIEALKIDCNINNAYALRRNLAYNLQYLELLNLEIEELNVTSVLEIMLIKNFVVTGMSILEGLFSNIIKSHGWWKQTDLEFLGESISNETEFKNGKMVVKTFLYEKVEPYDEYMSLDSMIRVLSHHHDALDVDHLVYPALKRLKELRNRVHLQKLDSNTDHDYNAFDQSVLDEMKAILHAILTSEMICNDPSVFVFLNP